MGRTTRRISHVCARGAALVLAVLLSSVVLGLASRPALAEGESDVDRVHLQNGRSFEGRIIAQDAESVVLELASEDGGRGRMRFPLTMVRRIERGTTRPAPRSPGSVRDTWYLLKSGPHVVGSRRLVLRHVRPGGCPGWRIEETIEHFARGVHVPAVNIFHQEVCDLAFRPSRLLYREVGEASPDPQGPRRYERIQTGAVQDGIWDALLHVGGEAEQRKLRVPNGARGRLGTREHLLRRREVGLVEVVYFDAGNAVPVTVRAGYTGFGLPDGQGGVFDEFVWEEAGVRLVSRFENCEIVEEAVADGVVAVPATEAQVEAARAERGGRGGDPSLVRLADLGLTLRIPDPSWTFARVEAPLTASGWRKVAVLECRPLVADVRIEWDPAGATVAPSAAEASQRLMQRLRAWCPDLRVLRPLQPLALRSAAATGEGTAGGVGARVAGREAAAQPAWRMDFTGTLKGERVRTVAVIVDRGRGRVLLLVACPEVSWPQVARAVDKLVASLERF